MDKRVPFLIAIASLALGRAHAEDPRPVAPTSEAKAAAGPQAPVVAKPTVVTSPSFQDFQKGYPVKGWNDHVVGRADLKCDLPTSGVPTGCAVLRESPSEEGFGEAALKLAPLYRLTPFTVDGAAIEHEMTMRIDFPLPKLAGEPAASETPVSHPWWTCPDPNAPPRRFYPKGAQGQNVGGNADIECRMLTTGRVVACTWVSEDPPGYGFGEKAEQLGCQMKMKMAFAVPEGVTPEIRIVRAPIRFKIGS